MGESWNNAPWNSAFAICSLDNGIWSFLILESKQTPISRKLKRWPGGKAKGHDKKPERTGRRELKEETGLRLKPSAKVLELGSYEVENGHIQHFFGALYKDCIGTLRNEIKHEESGAILYVPRWVTLEYAMAHLDGNHRRAARSLAGKIHLFGGKMCA
jgi:8-oxo-dGTP pyrophosphatase MutT (NUDIX family)